MADHGEARSAQKSAGGGNPPTGGSDHTASRTAEQSHPTEKEQMEKGGRKASSKNGIKLSQTHRKQTHEISGRNERGCSRKIPKTLKIPMKPKPH